MTNTPQSAFWLEDVDASERGYLEQRCCCFLLLENIFRVGWIS